MVCCNASLAVSVSCTGLWSRILSVTLTLCPPVPTACAWLMDRAARQPLTASHRRPYDMWKAEEFQTPCTDRRARVHYGCGNQWMTPSKPRLRINWNVSGAFLNGQKPGLKDTIISCKSRSISVHAECFRDAFQEYPQYLVFHQ
jgi:hypothetical protein